MANPPLSDHGHNELIRENAERLARENGLELEKRLTGRSISAESNTMRDVIDRFAYHASPLGPVGLTTAAVAPTPIMHHPPLLLCSPRDAMLDVRMSLPWGEAEVTGTVVMTNPPGDRMLRNLPVGMAVRFDRTAPETRAALVMYAEERLRTLGV